MSRNNPRPSRRRQAFTLVELLVVIGIIAVLIGILLPALSRARRAGNAAVCMNNLRQFGVAVLLYSQQYGGYLPCEGLSEGSSAANPLGLWDDPSFWANVLPPMINRRYQAYYDMQTLHLSGTQRLPCSGDTSLFVCPDAKPAGSNFSPTEFSDGYFMMWGLKPGSTSATGPKERRPTYWCYVYNSGLDNIIATGVVDQFGTRHIKFNQVKPAGEVPLLVEAATIPGECDPPLQNSMNRGKTKGNSWDSCRISSRHNKGGNLLFVDGHVGWISRVEATTDWPGDGTYNKAGHVIWQPHK